MDMYETLDVGVGHFEDRYCEDAGCAPVKRPAAIYVGAGGGHYLCTQHFARMIEHVASELRRAAGN